MKEFEKIHYKHYKKTANIYNAPGVVKLMGDYINHTGGKHLSCFINSGVVVSVNKSLERKFNFFVNDESTVVNIFYDNVFISQENIYVHLTSLILNEFIYNFELIVGVEGIVHVESEHTGIDTITSYIIAVTKLLNDFNLLNLSEEIVRKICHNVYNKFTGETTPYNLSVFNMKRKHVSLFDTRAGICKQTNVNFEDFSLLIAYDKTIIEDTEFSIKERMNESVSAHMIVDSKFKHEFLSDFTIHELNECKDDVRDFEFKRIRHAITENIRVDDLFESLEKDDIVKTGLLLSNSEISLLQDYEMVTKKQDTLCNLVSRYNALGAKMISSKYNSSVVVLVKDLQIPTLIKQVSTEYKNRFGNEIEFIKTNIY
ncbi:MAG: galactokinase family protein [bacterium]